MRSLSILFTVLIISFAAVGQQEASKTTLLSTPEWFKSDFRIKAGFNQLFNSSDNNYNTSLVGVHQSLEVKLIPKFGIGVNYGLEYLVSSNTNEQELREVATSLYLNTTIRLLKGEKFLRYLRFEYGIAPALTVKRKSASHEDFVSLNTNSSPSDNRVPLLAGVKLGIGLNKTNIEDFIRLEIGYEYRETNNPSAWVIKDYVSAAILIKFF